MYNELDDGMDIREKQSEITNLRQSKTKWSNIGKTCIVIIVILTVVLAIFIYKYSKESNIAETLKNENDKIQEEKRFLIKNMLEMNGTNPVIDTSSEEKVTIKKSVYDVFQKEYDLLLKENDVLKNELSEANNKIKEQKSKIQTLEDEKSKLKENLNKVESDYNKEKEGKDLKDSEIANITKAYDNLLDENEELARENTALKDIREFPIEDEFQILYVGQNVSPQMQIKIQSVISEYREETLDNLPKTVTSFMNANFGGLWGTMIYKPDLTKTFIQTASDSAYILRYKGLTINVWFT